MSETVKAIKKLGWVYDRQRIGWVHHDHRLDDGQLRVFDLPEDVVRHVNGMPPRPRGKDRDGYWIDPSDPKNGMPEARAGETFKEFTARCDELYARRREGNARRRRVRAASNKKYETYEEYRDRLEEFHRSHEEAVERIHKDPNSTATQRVSAMIVSHHELPQWRRAPTEQEAREDAAAKGFLFGVLLFTWPVLLGMGGFLIIMALGTVIVLGKLVADNAGLLLLLVAGSVPFALVVALVKFEGVLGKQKEALTAKGIMIDPGRRLNRRESW